MLLDVELHLEYDLNRPSGEIHESVTGYLARRRELFRQRIAALRIEKGQRDDESEWLLRSFPVLSILAPVMSTHEDKIEFPGDPMCLYSALSYAVDQAVLARIKGFEPDSPYNDLCPQWGFRPSHEYRRSVEMHGVRKYDDRLLNTDQTVFDPRVWNDKVKKYFVDVVLKTIQPRVVLISAVSPVHRYAIDIARTVKEQLPGCIVVLGGRHTDETIHYNPLSKSFDFAPTSSVKLIIDQAIESVFDFFIAGQGYYALDLLMKSIALAMDVETKEVDTAGVMNALSVYSPLFRKVYGHALIVGLNAGKIHAWPISGPKVVLSDLPSPYKAFAIRARFPVFERDGRVLLTAHFMVTNSCPYHCYFCSEGSAVVGEFLSFRANEVTRALERVIEYLDYGAEAIFFDDSMFWGGNVGHIINFCKGWIELREYARQQEAPTLQLFGREIDRQSILDLVWGAQLTVDSISSRRIPGEADLMLKEMYDAGCTYLYIGIESMSEPVIKRVHKNINHSLHWDQRVRMALGMVRHSGIRVGSSVLFGLDGETQETIAETVEKVEELLAEDLLMIASPNILTYHPNTEISRLHGMDTKLDYHSINLENRPPYSYFEEAFPAVVSRNLTEADIWNIHQQTQERWGTKRNSTPMPPVALGEA